MLTETVLLVGGTKAGESREIDTSSLDAALRPIVEGNELYTRRMLRLNDDAPATIYAHSELSDREVFLELLSHYRP